MVIFLQQTLAIFQCPVNNMHNRFDIHIRLLLTFGDAVCKVVFVQIVFKEILKNSLSQESFFDKEGKTANISIKTSLTYMLNPPSYNHL